VEQKDLYDAPMVSLGDVCEFLPKSKRQASYGNKEGLYPFFKSSSILNSYTNDADYNEASLIIGDGGQANINYSHKFSASDHCYILQNNDKVKLLLEYLYYYLYFNIDKMNNLFSGSGIKNMSKEKLRNLKIPLPSLEVQQQIVDELSTIESSIQTLETRIYQLKTEKEQYINSKLKKNNI
jgi:restriction endonuclease S subunit